MRKHALLLCVLALLYLCSSFAIAAQTHKLSDSPTEVQLLNQDRSSLMMELNVGEVMFVPVNTKGGDFTMISIKGCGRSFDLLGEPDLPKANKLLAIPKGAELRAEVISYELEEIDLAELGIEYPLLPTQPSLSKSDDPDFVPFEYDQSIYESKGFYSHDLITTEELGTMRGVQIGRISISPVEYNPTEHIIKVYKNIIVKVDFVGGDWTKSESDFRESYSPCFETVYNRLFNYSPSMFLTEKGDLVKYPITYLIVSDPMFESQLQEFIEWKTKKGFNVIEAYTDDIGTSKSAIKSWIEDQYNTLSPKPSFVLLVGDDSEIEAWSGTAGYHITDLYYCEFTDDDFPEIYYGRFSAQNTTLLQPQIDKTLEYEKYEMPDPSYLERVTLIAGVDASHAPTYGNGQINYGTNLYFNLAHGIDPNVWLYPASDASGASAAVIASVNEGVGYANYTAHCGHSSWSDPSFTTSHISSLTNAHKYGLAVGNCCSSNTFAEGTSPCWGEAWLQEEDKGGVGYIGASNSTYWDEDYYWGCGYGPIVGNGPTYEQTTMGAYDGVFHDHGEPDSLFFVTNDAMLFAGNLGVTAGGSRVTYYWEAYHLMGDPSVMNYMGVPSANTVTHPATFLLTEPTMTVQADEGSYVAITYDGVIYGTGHVGSTGEVVIDIDPFAAPCQADIVVTAQNKQPYISTIQVILPTGPYVIYDESDIDDASGNNNGVVDLGESIIMGVQVKNVGPDDASNVDATVATPSTHVTLTDDNEYYGTVLGDEGTAYSATAFAFDVHDDAPDGHVIQFDLSVTDGTKDTWESSFSHTVHAPILSDLSISIEDGSGNGNSILDPGETADIIVTIGNSGSGIANSVTGLLAEDDTFITLDDASGTFGDISPDGGTADNTADVFTASADASCPMGYAVPMTLSLTSTGGYTIDLILTITVGDRVVFYYDDFSFDQGWTGLGGSAEWEIAGCQGEGGDPSVDHSPTTDNQVLGNDLTDDGQYENSINPTQYVAKWIDCTDYTGIELRFQRWLGVEDGDYDHAYFEVFDGTTWHVLYENGSDSDLDETEWSEQYYDVSEYADGNSDFEIRFGMGTTDGSETHSGWNIDDIEIKGYYQGTGGIPNLVLNPSTVADSLLDDQTVAETVRVYNTGDGELRVRFNPGDDWITCVTDNNYIAAGDSLDFEFDVNTEDMEPGIHSGSLMFTSNDPGVITGELPVNIFIHAPTASITTESVVDSLVEGDVVQHTIHVDNTGLGNLHISFSTEDSWIDCSESDNLVPPSGYLDFEVELDATDMEPGNHTGSVAIVSNDPSYPSGSVDVELYVYEPVLGITQTSIDVELGQLEELTELLTIANNGPGRLHYTLSHVMFDMKAVKGAGGTIHIASSSSTDGVEPLGYRIADPDKTGIEEPYYPAVEKGSGGPDDYGYRWIDSDESGGPVYSWIDISTVGTELTLADDGISSALDMGFGFPFYEDIYEDVYVTGNGYLTFTETPSAYTTNQDLPNATIPNNVIAAYWDDLNPAAGGNIYYYADTANERFVVSYVAVPFYKSGAGTGSLTFQVILYPSGKIETQYGTMEPGDVYAGLEGATIGLENYNASDGLTVVYNASYMHDNLAIKISSTAWLSLGSVSGTIEPYGSDQVEVIFRANELDFGMYEGQINVNCDDPANPTMSVPVSLLVYDNSYICGDADGSGAVDIDDVVYIITYLFASGPAPDPLESAEVDCSGSIDIDDAVYLIEYLFAGGPDPCEGCK